VTARHCAGPVLVTWLDEEDVAALTRTPVHTVRGWRVRTIGPAYCRVGRRILYAAADVDAFVLAGRVETSGTVDAPGPDRPPVRTPVRSDDVRSADREDGGRRPPVGPGAVSPGVQTAATVLAGVPASGDLSPDLNNGSHDGQDDVA
jgi:hypothetical protein